MDALGRKHMRPDRFDQRHQRCRVGPDPIRKRRDVEIDPLTRINRALAIERQMNMSQQPWPGAPARNRV